MCYIVHLCGSSVPRVHDKEAHTRKSVCPISEIQEDAKRISAHWTTDFKMTTPTKLLREFGTKYCFDNTESNVQIFQYSSFFLFYGYNWLLRLIPRCMKGKAMLRFKYGFEPKLANNSPGNH
uniref:DDE_Tnp_1_7 domain-containing protein n=1 Tax=Steinernema glaseri TaxID=37863 RepID=A0A1I7Y900_9BILA